MSDAVDSVEDALLRANQAFYDAFASADVEAMAELWSEQHPVACIHPGWQVLLGRDEVLASWRAILLNEGPAVECREPRAFGQGDAGFVVCLERIGDGVLSATNCFVLEAGVWRMLHHHAGPVAQVEMEVPASGLN